jgi:hypothetical protein
MALQARLSGKRLPMNRSVFERRYWVRKNLSNAMSASRLQEPGLR